MKPILKIAAVTAGYIASFVIASAVVTIHIWATSGPAGQASSGMYAFGDAFLFLSVFAVCGLLPSCIALFFLRPYRPFWTVLSIIALGISITAIAGTAFFLAGRHAESSFLAAWASASVLRILIAPFLALTFFVCAVFSPYRFSRVALFVATAMEMGATACGGFVWFLALLLTL